LRSGAPLGHAKQMPKRFWIYEAGIAGVLGELRPQGAKFDTFIRRHPVGTKAQSEVEPYESVMATGAAFKAVSLPVLGACKQHVTSPRLDISTALAASVFLAGAYAFLGAEVAHAAPRKALSWAEPEISRDDIEMRDTKSVFEICVADLFRPCTTVLEVCIIGLTE